MLTWNSSKTGSCSKDRWGVPPIPLFMTPWYCRRPLVSTVGSVGDPPHPLTPTPHNFHRPLHSNPPKSINQSKLFTCAPPRPPHRPAQSFAGKQKTLLGVTFRNSDKTLHCLAQSSYILKYTNNECPTSHQCVCSRLAERLACGLWGWQREVEALRLPTSVVSPRHLLAGRPDTDSAGGFFHSVGLTQWDWDSILSRFQKRKLFCGNGVQTLLPFCFVILARANIEKESVGVSVQCVCCVTLTCWVILFCSSWVLSEYASGCYTSVDATLRWVLHLQPIRCGREWMLKAGR